MRSNCLMMRVIFFVSLTIYRWLAIHMWMIQYILLHVGLGLSFLFCFSFLCNVYFMVGFRLGFVLILNLCVHYAKMTWLVIFISIISWKKDRKDLFFFPRPFPKSGRRRRCVGVAVLANASQRRQVVVGGGSSIRLGDLRCGTWVGTVGTKPFWLEKDY